MMGRRKAAEKHEKSMGSYELFAWRDAMSIAVFLNEEIGMKKTQKYYDPMDIKSVLNFEAENQELIQDFIQKSESQRPAFLKRITKNISDQNREEETVTFLILCIIGCLRVKKVLEIRDNYRFALVPGYGNRITMAGVYGFAAAMEGVYDNYDFPSEVFDAVDDYYGDDYEE